MKAGYLLGPFRETPKAEKENLKRKTTVGTTLGCAAAEKESVKRVGGGTASNPPLGLTHRREANTKRRRPNFRAC